MADARKRFVKCIVCAKHGPLRAHLTPDPSPDVWEVYPDDCPSKVIVALLNAAPELLEATDEVARLQAENRVLRAELDGFLPSMDGGPSAASEALGTNAALRSLVAAWKPVVRAADEWQGCGRTKEAKLLGALYALTDAQREAAR